MSNKSLIILEIIWIATGFLCIAAGIRIIIINGYNNRILIFAIMALVSFLFAWFRHRQRKKS
jgi:hypothetical protein